MEVNSEGLKGIPESEPNAVIVELFQPSNGHPQKMGSLFETPIPADLKEKWSRNIDFLFVCTGFCAGLANFWRFPLVALQHGGGSFLIAYFILVIFVGLPMLYLEVIVAQFVSRSGARLFDCAPIMRGLGYVQLMLSLVIASYYSSIASIAGKYLIATFRTGGLPWSGDILRNFSNESEIPARIYYRNNIIADLTKESSSLFSFNQDLLIYLAICWISVCIVTARGIRALSQLGCFLLYASIAIFITFLAQIFSMPGAGGSLWNHMRPRGRQFANFEIWYDAMIQMFYSLGICFGPMTLYASYNSFSYNMFIDIIIMIWINFALAITIALTFFAMLGIVTFDSSIFDLNWFVLYSEMIAKLDFFPKITSVLIFALLFLIAIASISTFTFFIVKMLRYEFLLKNESAVILAVVAVMFLLGCFHLTPIGEYWAMLYDQYGIPCAIGLVAVLELYAFAWIYGVRRICHDIEFMFGFRTMIIWPVAWSLIPILITLLLIYHLIYGAAYLALSWTNKNSFSTAGYTTCWIFFTITLLIIGIWGVNIMLRQPKELQIKRWIVASKPVANWGPAESSLLLSYRYFILRKNNPGL